MRLHYGNPFAPIQIIAGDTRKTAVFCVAGYLMNAGSFNNNHVSTGDLNRGRRTESRVLFGYFLHDAKSDNPYSFVGSSEVLQTSIQLAAMAASPPMKLSFRKVCPHSGLHALRAFPPYGGHFPAA